MDFQGSQNDPFRNMKIKISRNVNVLQLNEIKSIIKRKHEKYNFKAFKVFCQKLIDLQGFQSHHVSFQDLQGFQGMADTLPMTFPF